MGAMSSTSQTYGDIALPYESQFLLFLNDHCEAGNFHCQFNEFISAVATYMFSQNHTLGFEGDMETTVYVIKCLIKRANSQGYAIKFGGIVCSKRPSECVCLTGIRMKSFPTVHDSLSNTLQNYTSPR